MIKELWLDMLVMKTLNIFHKSCISLDNYVKEFMNFYITSVMEEYTPEFDQMLFYLPLAGSTFKKVYYDENLDRAVSKFIPAEDLVVPYSTSDLET